MRWKRVAIESVGFVLPQNVVTSEQLEERFAATLKRIGLPRGQVEKLSGVRERRYFDPETPPSSVAALAAEKALAKAGWKSDQLGALINTSVSRDYLEPATAAMVAGKLGLRHESMAIDVGNACVGFLNGMWVLADLIELGAVERGIVVCAENVTHGCDATIARLAAPDATVQTFRDNFASLTLGCAAVAFTMCRDDLAKTPHRLHGGVSRTAAEHNLLCLAQYGEMRADAHGLLVHGVNLAAETWPHAVREMGWGPNSVDVVIGHQVSLAHFSSVFERIEQPIDKCVLTLPYLGNCGPCSLPVTLGLAEAQGRVVPGSELALYAVGSGLSCVIMGVRW